MMPSLFHPFSFFTLLLSLLLFGTLRADDKADLIKEGLRHYHSGEYDAAAGSFEQAGLRKKGGERGTFAETSSEQAMLFYNQACSLVAAGKAEEALEPLRHAASGKDPNVAVLARMLLADLAVRRAKTVLGSEPEKTAPQDREKVREDLSTAESWYTNILEEPDSGSPEIPTVRRNLERVRAWRRRMEQRWLDADREQALHADFYRYLDSQRKRQWELLENVREQSQVPTSPVRSQELYLASREQDRLAGNMESVKEYLKETGGYASFSDLPSEESAEKQGKGLLDEVIDMARNGADALRRFQTDEAIPLQSRSVELLETLFTSAVPYEMLLREAVARQERLLQPDPAAGKQETAAGISHTSDPAEEAWKQELAARMVRPLLDKAGRGLEELGPSTLPEDTEKPVNPSVSVPDFSASPLASPGNDREEERRNRLRESMRRALRYGDEVENSLREAARNIAENKRDQARPGQEQALVRLREILEPLEDMPPENEAQQGEQQQDQQAKDDKQQGSSDQSQQSGQENKRQQEQQQQEDGKKEQQQQEKPENGSSPRNRKEEASQDAQSKEDAASVDPERAKEAAERMIRQVRRRQQEAEENREKVRTQQMQAVPVEKDW